MTNCSKEVSSACLEDEAEVATGDVRVPPAKAGDGATGGAALLDGELAAGAVKGGGGGSGGDRGGIRGRLNENLLNQVMRKMKDDLFSNLFM